MIYKNIHQFKKDNFREKAILAIDYGEKKFGVAVSDKEQSMAFPKEVYHRKALEVDINFIRSQILTYGSEIILLGLALNKDGTITKTAQQAKSFANVIQQNIPSVDIFFWDERFTTMESQKLMHYHNVSAEDAHSNDDAIAASIILSTFLEFRKNS